jgi:probable biosynthetic protein (TIGR04098 family)
LSAWSAFLRKQQSRWHRIGIDRRHELRRRLIHYVVHHGFEIGDFSIGVPTIRFFWDGTRLKVGKFCSIAEGATFVLGGGHRTDFVSGFPFMHMTEEVGPGDRPHARGDIVVGSDVWIAAGATILSGVTVGDGAVIGAGSVVIDDVPPYAVVFGNPARMVSKRFPDDVVAALLELRWWDLPEAQVRALRPLLTSADVDGFMAACREARGLPPVAPKAASPPDKPPSSPTVTASGLSGNAGDLVVVVFRQQCPSFSADHLDRPFAEIGVDSFALLVIRARIEEARGIAIADSQWVEVRNPADIVRLVSAQTGVAKPAAAGTQAHEHRSYQLNMPQMALGGLSESWLFKEFGDIHWHMITNGLGAPSDKLTDAGGERLYATFTRFRLTATEGLSAYRENEQIEVDARIARYGAGLFFSETIATGNGRSVSARLMSSFARIGEGGSNTALLKGQPEIPSGCEIPVLADFPAFGRGYGERRAATLAAPLFECEYEIIPNHDINGVGLLYFAAYPMINDICVARYAGRSYATRFSTRHRDVFYFANSDPDDTLIFRLHRWQADDHRIEAEGSISRKSDGVLMAYIVTAKDAVAANASRQV